MKTHKREYHGLNVTAYNDSNIEWVVSVEGSAATQRFEKKDIVSKASEIIINHISYPMGKNVTKDIYDAQIDSVELAVVSLSASQYPPDPNSNDLMIASHIDNRMENSIENYSVLDEHSLNT